jgi:ADP-ribosyl-[dinitrogen reductase] hydrolase
MNHNKLACLLGLALGDAVGCTVEFCQRGSFEPVTNMVGGGKFELAKGQWTDDTSMALCLASSLAECNGFNASDQMDRYIKWFDEGYFSCKPKGFGIGKQTARAIGRYIKSGDPFAGLNEPNQAGNGALMRIAPVAMYYSNDPEKAVHFGIESTRTTHGADEALEASALFVSMLLKAFQGKTKEDILNTSVKTISPAIQSICNQSYKLKHQDDIYSTGYVVHTLEAALWAFYHTNSFEEAILKVVNLGDDADTCAAVCGQIAGAFYGYDGLPKHWLENLWMRDEIEQLALLIER